LSVWGFFYGAEFTLTCADYFSGKDSPTDVAVKITDKADARHKDANYQKMYKLCNLFYKLCNTLNC
jgi:hypothetical protein